MTFCHSDTSGYQPSATLFFFFYLTTGTACPANQEGRGWGKNDVLQIVVWYISNDSYDNLSQRDVAMGEIELGAPKTRERAEGLPSWAIAGPSGSSRQSFTKIKCPPVSPERLNSRDLINKQR